MAKHGMIGESGFGLTHGYEDADEPPNHDNNHEYKGHGVSAGSARWKYQMAHRYENAKTSRALSSDMPNKKPTPPSSSPTTVTKKPGDPRALGNLSG